MHTHLKAICFSFLVSMKASYINPVIQMLPVVSFTPQRGEPLCNGKEKDQRALHKCDSMALSSWGHSKNHCKPISCACCSLSFISESLLGIRYPLMEERGVCQRPVTFWIQLQEVKSTHYQSRSPQKRIGSRFKISNSIYFLSDGGRGWLLENCFSSETKAFQRQIGSTIRREMSLPVLFYLCFTSQLMFTPRIWALSASFCVLKHQYQSNIQQALVLSAALYYNVLLQWRQIYFLSLSCH